MNIVDLIKQNREAGTPGKWQAPYETCDNGWYLDTEGENSYVGIGPACENQTQIPIAITAVESLRQDNKLDANAARIALVPDMEEVVLAAADVVVDYGNGVEVEAMKRLETLLRQYRD